MKQENDLDFDVFSQSLFSEPSVVQQDDCAALADIIGSIELQADGLDFDVMGQACFQEPASDIDADCAALAQRILEGGLRKCARVTPLYRSQVACGYLEVRAAMRRRPKRAGAQAPPT